MLLLSLPVRLQRRISADARELALLRRELRRWLGRIGATRQDIDDITLACSEACANAIEHPVDRSDGSIEVEARADGGNVEIVVRDFGHWRNRKPPPDRGHGLYLMRAVMDVVDVRPSAIGTEVLLRRRLHVNLEA